MPSRRLAAILAADVAGYSRLMGADEEGTHERLKAHIRELIDPKIAERRGRVPHLHANPLAASMVCEIYRNSTHPTYPRAIVSWRRSEPPRRLNVIFGVLL
jgi:class 3 adenylate cyclase